MNIADTRRTVLRSLIEREFGGVARRLALRLEKPEGQINDMLANPPRKSFGERIARAMEDKLELPQGYFDQPSNTTTVLEANEPKRAAYKPEPKHSKQALAVAAYYDRLPVEKQAEVEEALIAICLSIPEEKRSELAEILTLFR